MLIDLLSRYVACSKCVLSSYILLQDRLLRSSGLPEYRGFGLERNAFHQSAQCTVALCVKVFVPLSPIMAYTVRIARQNPVRHNRKPIP